MKRLSCWRAWWMSWVAGVSLLGVAAEARFINITMDGSLSEWLIGDRLYQDSEITDGAPLASTYSDVYVANDATNLYIGLKLKAPSSIYSNWTHSLLIDTDGDSGTGYNAGWMSGGYDRLVQYGAGGSTYSLYTFSGSLQSVWSWTWNTTISYAYSGDEIEWAIPRSYLGGATAVRLQFFTDGGDVTIQTWAHEFESSAKTYTFSATPIYTVTVVSARGTPTPGVGSHSFTHGTNIAASVSEPSPSGGTQYVCLGWTMTGHSPSSGSTTNFSMTLTNHAALTWLWQTNVEFSLSTNGPGSVSGSAPGYHAKDSTVNLTATPNAGYIFKGWSGDVPAGQTNDNPLALTMDRKRSVTANFGTFAGKFQTKSVDGSMADWTTGERFYVDSEITDGSPAASTYSNVYAANDHENLYLALETKAPSTIFSNWTHHVFLDTDLDPGTGYNAGWMSGGYDVMVQYGAGGATYSVFSFSGGTQSSWSWSYITTIGYGYNDNVIEWAIPRSALGGSTSMKIELLTEGGDVGYGPGVTWAHSTEAQARIYTMAATPIYTVTVASARGTPTPGVGSHSFTHGTNIAASVIEPTPASGTQYVSLGWTMTGQSPTSGSTTNFSMTLTNHATLTWNWQTNVYFTRTAGLGGSINGATSGYYEIGSIVTVTAAPSSGYTFAGWSGAVPPAQASDNPLNLTLDAARSITATFQRDVGRYVTISLDGMNTDWLGSDVFYTDAEISDGAPLNSSYSAVYVANDTNYLYVALDMKANSSIFSNWTHNLFIDVDGNPATGYNAGWMSGGYDRLVQFGAGGSTYSIFSFSGGTQSTWSWSFISTIAYSYSDLFFEWAIPRSALAGATEVRLQFLTDGSGISVETWAAEFESAAKTYAFSTPDGCVPGYAPAINPIGNKTILVGGTLNFGVTAHDPRCIAPTLTISNKPAGASFSTTVSGTNRVGTFTWTPTGSDVGTYPVRFRATDDEGNTTSRVILVYVGNSGDSTNSAGVPSSQTNWAVAVTNLSIPVSGVSTLYWSAAVGIPYDIYRSTDAFGPGMTWTLVVTGHEAAAASESRILNLSGPTNFIQVVPSGIPPSLVGVWGIIAPQIQNGWNMLSPPIETKDLAFDGAFGRMLAASLTGGTSSSSADQIHALDGSGSPYMLWLNSGDGLWYEGASPTTRALVPGQGFMVYRQGSATTLPIAGRVGNRGTNSLTILNGRWNLIGLSQGMTISGDPLPGTSISGTPLGSYSFNGADLISFIHSDGSWKMYQRFGDNTWRDLDAPGTPISTITMSPGRGFYYYRQVAGGDMIRGF